MSITTVRKIFVTLGLPQVVAALIIRVTAILDAMTANKTTFPSPPLALALVTAHVAALSVAEAGMKTRAVGTKQVRDAALELVIADVNQLHGYVQQLCNASPTQAATIAANAAMALRKAGVRPKHDLTVKQTVQGTLHVVAGNVIKGCRAHEWQYSVDAGKTWTAAPPTTQAHTVITGFSTGVVVQVRHRSIGKAGPGDWTAPVTFAVT